VEQAEVSREPDARADVGLGARLEDIERAGEDEGELEGCAQRLVAGLRGEYRDVEGVILRVYLVSFSVSRMERLAGRRYMHILAYYA
jgi:hypothetical protein